ncbi:MAG: RpiB/LacA/LacB family sugar-phosphate isomerase [Saprospiraceae bacterium]|nr:RpiB/LacA/LacB family sugar-phosphate isomerase [Saprospiraceae bacterium]
MIIAIGNDHAGTTYKLSLVNMLTKAGHTVLNQGTDGQESVDYPDFAHQVATLVTEGKAELGIVICGSGNGVAMVANKHPRVRAALAWTEEIAALAREHNNANVLAIPARYVSLRKARAMANIFISTSFAGGRHGRRVDKIPC